MLLKRKGVFTFVELASASPFFLILLVQFCFSLSFTPSCFIFFVQYFFSFIFRSILCAQENEADRLQCAWHLQSCDY